MRKMTKEWLNTAYADLQTVEVIISREDLSGIASFHVQQAIEKTLKAILEEKCIEIPKIHKLKTLFSIVPQDFLKFYNDFIVKAPDELYIEARYPGEFGLLTHGKPSVEDVEEFYRYSNDVYQAAVDMLSKGEI